MDAKIEGVEVRVFKTLTWTTKDSDGHTHPGPDAGGGYPTVAVLVNGAEGHCLCQAEAVRPFVLDGYVRKVLVGEDGFMRERIWKRLYRMQRGSGGQLTDRAVGYVDQALWDLAGRKLGVPVWNCSAARE